MKTHYEFRLEEEFDLDRSVFPEVEESFWKKCLDSRITMESLAERLRLEIHPMNYDKTTMPFSDMDFY